MIENKSIPLHLIDEPDPPMRSDIPDEYIADLADRIARQGLINPISVFRRADRYEIAAGHCRYLAHKKLNRSHIECRDFTESGLTPEEIKATENLHRKDVNDADTAVYLGQIQEKYHYPLEKLMEITGKSEFWINQRLELFSGDQDVFMALHAGKINIGQAVELNKYPDQFRIQYLTIAIESTPPVKQLTKWRKELIAMGLDQYKEQPTADGQTPAQPVPGLVDPACELCGGTAQPWTMKFIRVHEFCAARVIAALKQEQNS